MVVAVQAALASMFAVVIYAPDAPLNTATNTPSPYTISVGNPAPLIAPPAVHVTPPLVEYDDVPSNATATQIPSP